MIWLKRILPLVLIGAAWFSYTEYTENRMVENERLARKYALVTAQVWLATAVYRNDNSGFLRVRDSLCQASGFSLDELNSYLQEHKKRPEFYTPYVRLVKTFVDSLTEPASDSTGD
ncbi:MAG: hypothetical protein OEV49_09430 [candidate division Zixibacteria bacterium]|nr:hypothetical protein [candidate division Zixibacteria bacterium]MDH3938039.1 hypothetical protein [candidate division Zixibacteria bacterium]MDH4033869.1 hypothetical protein [candidate division Zixibacteria bacterium]